MRSRGISDKYFRTLPTLSALVVGGDQQNVERNLLNRAVKTKGKKQKQIQKTKNKRQKTKQNQKPVDYSKTGRLGKR